MTGREGFFSRVREMFGDRRSADDDFSRRAKSCAKSRLRVKSRRACARFAFKAERGPDSIASKSRACRSEPADTSVWDCRVGGVHQGIAGCRHRARG